MYATWKLLTLFFAVKPAGWAKLWVAAGSTFMAKWKRFSGRNRIILLTSKEAVSAAVFTNLCHVYLCTVCDRSRCPWNQYWRVRSYVQNVFFSRTQVLYIALGLVPRNIICKPFDQASFNRVQIIFGKSQCWWKYITVRFSCWRSLWIRELDTVD